MLSVPTLWVVFIVNFLALGLVWTYAMRSYPTLAAAPYWAAASFVAAFFTAIPILRGHVDSMLTLVIGGGGVIFAVCLCTMGIRRFYERPVSWRTTFVTVGVSVAGLSFFVYVRDGMPMRVFIYSAAQAIPIALTLKMVLSRQGGPHQFGSPARGNCWRTYHLHHSDQVSLRIFPDWRRNVLRRLQWFSGCLDVRPHVPVDGMELRVPFDGD